MYSEGRLIFLADLDCFFVEVERLHRPELRGRAVVIGGEPGLRGVVASCSYEARRFGIHSAMSMGEAYKRARGQGVVFLHDGLFGRYSLYSRRVQDILASEVPLMRVKSFDEFELDLSGCELLLAQRHGGVAGFAEHLRRRVRAETGLPLSIGIGPGGIVAKMASKRAKPDGVYRVSAAEAPGFLAPQPVAAVPGIGEVSAAELARRGIETVGQLLELPEQMLQQSLGLGILKLARALRGEPADEAAIAAPGLLQSESKRRSIGHSITLPRDSLDPLELSTTLWSLTEDSCRRLRERGLKARHLVVTLRYSDYMTVTRGSFLAEPTDVDSAVYEQALELYAAVNTRRLRIRLLGVRLSRFVAGGAQAGLFETEADLRERRLCQAVDALRSRYGRDSLYVGPGVQLLSDSASYVSRGAALGSLGTLLQGEGYAH